MTFFNKRLFWASSLGHTILDIFNSSREVIVAFFSVPLGLTDSMIGLTIGLYQFTGSLTQPLFGWLSDRYGLRWLLSGSVAWSMAFITLGAIAASKGSFAGLLLFFVLGSLGSAAFHPVGTKYSALTTVQKTATATAFFFLFGQFGLAGGPFIAGLALERQGISGIILMALFTLPVLGFVLATPTPAISKQAKSAPDKAIPTEKRQKVSRKAMALLIFHTFCRSWTQIGTIAFIPKLFQDKGWDPAAYGAITSVMWLSSAIAGVIAGNMADKYGRRQVIFVVMILAIVPLYFLPASDTAFAFVLAALVGGLTGAPHSITVVIAQKMMPNLQATASGLILGLIFGMGSLAAILIGQIADIWTLERALQLGALMALLAAFSALALPQTREVKTTEVEKVG